MYYAPHTLYKITASELRKDEFGFYVKDGNAETEVFVCKCRCDDNSEQTIEDDSGRVHRPTYHIVCEGHIAGLQKGDKVVCKDAEGNVRARGQLLKRPKVLNYLNYTEIWL